MTESTKTSEEISYRSELQRKFLHLLALIIPLIISIIGKEASLWILIPLSTLALGLEVARVRSKWIASLIYRLFGSIMRAKEKPPIGSPIVVNGATWVMISATLLTLIFPVYIACSSLAMFMLGDAAAAVIGRKFGRFHWPRSQKTLEGSLSFFLISSLTLWAFGFLDLAEAFIIGLCAALLEVIPIPINDNLRVPLLVASAIFLFLKATDGTDLSLFF